MEEFNNIDMEKKQDNEVNKNSVWSIVLAICIFAITSLLISFFNNPILIIFNAPISIVLIVLLIISIKKIKNQKLGNYIKLQFRLFFSGLIILVGSALMSFTMIRDYVIIILVLISLISLWHDVNLKKIFFVIPILLTLGLFVLAFNYLIIEPRINSINYLNNKYGFEKSKIQIENIKLICGGSNGLFEVFGPCMDMEVSYDEYEIYLYKLNNKWEDIVEKNGERVNLELKEDYINDNNIIIERDLREKLRSYIVNILEKYDIEYRKYNYWDYENGYYYYLVKTDKAENIKLISLDIKNKIKEMCDNLEDSYVLSETNYFVDITFTKRQDVYNKYEELILYSVEDDCERDVQITIGPEYTDIMNIDKYYPINSDAYYKINEEFLNLYNENNFENNYDYINFNIRFDGKLEYGHTVISTDAYFIKGVKRFKNEEKITCSY